MEGEGALTNGFANNIDSSFDIPEFNIPTDTSKNQCQLKFDNIA